MEKPEVSRTNGPAAAALLAMGIGCLALGILVVTSEANKAIGDKLNWYNPTGPLSGKTGLAILVWLASWAIIGRVWATKNVNLGRIGAVAFTLLVVGLLLAFPPVFDAFTGK